jgi:hypothetical protein
MKKDTVANMALEGDQVSDLAADLRDAYELLDGLCTQLEGGGIVTAGAIQPTVAQAVPKLRKAVMWLNTITMIGNNPLKSGVIANGDPARSGAKRPSKNPLLI